MDSDITRTFRLETEQDAARRVAVLTRLVEVHRPDLGSKPNIDEFRSVLALPRAPPELLAGMVKDDLYQHLTVILRAVGGKRIGDMDFAYDVEQYASLVELRGMCAAAAARADALPRFRTESTGKDSA